MESNIAISADIESKTSCLSFQKNIHKRQLQHSNIAVCMLNNFS